MKRKNILVWALGTSSLLFNGTGCSLAPEYVRPDVGLLGTYQEPADAGESLANLVWWELFKDPTLQELIRIALSENRDIQVAAARIDASRALLGIARADQFPQLDGAATTSRVEPSKVAAPLTGRPYNNFGLFGDLSFEVDLWGKLQNRTEAQRAELLASEYARRAVTIALVSQVAITYFNIQALDARLAISRKTVIGRRDSTAVIAARLSQGVVPELDLNQAQIEEADAAAAVAVFERRLKQTENALSVLLGRVPFTIKRTDNLDFNNLPTAIPTGFPAELLERRPDISAAEELVKAAYSRVGVAEAERFPSLNLLGFVGLQSEEIDDLIDGRAFTWSIGGDLVGPIFDWNKRASAVDVRKAEAEVQLKTYEQTVLLAVQEVEDALVSIRTFKEEYLQRKNQAVAAANAARLSRARYDEGVTSYLEVLDIERSLFDAELAAYQALSDYLASIVRLYKALGGGWYEEGAAVVASSTSAPTQTTNGSKKLN